MRVSIWVLDDDEEYEVNEQEKAGTFALRGEQVVIDDAYGDNLGMMQRILGERIPIPNSYEFVTADEDPQRWLSALLYQYHGTRMSARPEPDEEVA